MTVAAGGGQSAVAEAVALAAPVPAGDGILLHSKFAAERSDNYFGGKRTQMIR